MVQRRSLFHLFAAFFFLSLVLGCASGGWNDRRPATCAAFDSLFEYSGFEVPVTLQGTVTVDANQYRVRGKTRIETTPDGDISVDFASSVLFGSRREDFFFSVVSDTLRILDRERGEFYESSNAARFMRENLGMDFDPKAVIVMALGKAPNCRDIAGLNRDARSNGDIRFSGEASGEQFSVVFAAAHRKLREIKWPLRLEEGRDELRVTYDWKEGSEGTYRLRQVVIRLREREWRCKITAANM